MTVSKYSERSTGGWSDWRETMAALAIERQTKYETVPCHTFELSDIPDGEAVIVGSYSCTWMSAKRRYIKRQTAVDIGYGMQTPAEVARDYLNAKFGRAAPVRGKVHSGSTQFLAMPSYANPGKYKGHVYIDVRAAYWSIMGVVGWNCVYEPDRFLARGASVSDFPLPDNKFARNILVSCGLPSKMYILTKYGPKIKKTYNNLLNGNLWRLVSDTLHLLAAYALDECEAKYFLTDGAIIPDRHVEKYQAFGRSIGLELRFASDIGNAMVKAVGAYSLPGKVSRTIDRYAPLAHFNIRTVSPTLAKKLQMFVELSTWPKADGARFVDLTTEI